MFHPTKARVTPARSSPFKPMTTKRPWRRSDPLQGLVLMRNARAHRLDQEPHRLAGDSYKSFDAKHIVRVRDRRDPFRQLDRVDDFRKRHHETVEIVVVVVRLLVMKSAAILDVVLAADAQAEQRRRIDFSIGHGDDLNGPRQRAGYSRERGIEAGGVEEVALVQHHEVCTRDLVREHFLDRIVVIKRLIGGALPRQRLDVGGDAAVRQRGAVHHGNHAIHRNPAADRRPMKRLNQRLRQREAGGLDHDMLHRRPPRQDGVERRHEFVRHGAAQTAIGEFDDVLFRTGCVAATFQDFAIDADVAELVDDHGKPSALGVGEKVADQRGLSGAQEAGDDSAGHARERSGHQDSPEKSNGGVRATRPRFNGSGRPRQGINPSGAFANSLAPSINAPAPVAESRLPNT
jgi:hypothetical protein